MTAETIDDSHATRTAESLPAVNDSRVVPSVGMLDQFRDACRAWLMKSPSPDTRSNYDRDLRQFLAFCGFAYDEVARLPTVRPHQVAAWRDHLMVQGLSNSSVRRKMTVLRSLFSYLQTYGYVGANPAHSDFVAAPSVPRDGKTVGLTPEDCRRLLEVPSATTPIGLRDRAILAVLAYTGCRVGELARLRVGDHQQTGGHRVLNIRGKGGKERRVPLHPEAAERLDAWLDAASIRDDLGVALFRPLLVSRSDGESGFAASPLTRRAVQKLIKTYVRKLGLDPHVTVHSLRVTALTTARERGSDIIDLQDFAGHADPRTTLTYIRSRDRLSKSPAYVLRY
jgi:integrase/recombinase XerD